MLQQKIKASAITNLTDARYFAAWEVEWLSFNLAEGTEDYIEPGTMKAIREWVDGVEIVGEFSTHHQAEIQEWAKLLGLTWLQVGAHLGLGELEQLANYQLIQEIIITADTSVAEVKAQLERHQNAVQYFQLNFEQHGIAWENLSDSSTFTASDLQHICENYAIILSIAFQPENLMAMAEALPYAALNLQGGEEEKVGVKSFDDLDAILEQLEVEN